MPREKHSPTPESRAEVAALISFGVTRENIASHVGVSTVTLAKYYKTELANGAVAANARVAGTLYQLAVGGNIAAAIFWLKTRAGWRETTRIEAVGAADAAPIGVALNVSKLSTAALGEILAARDASEARPAGEVLSYKKNTAAAVSKSDPWR